MKTSLPRQINRDDCEWLNAVDVQHLLCSLQSVFCSVDVVSKTFSYSVWTMWKSSVLHSCRLRSVDEQKCQLSFLVVWLHKTIFWSLLDRVRYRSMRRFSYEATSTHATNYTREPMVTRVSFNTGLYILDQTIDRDRLWRLPLHCVLKHCFSHSRDLAPVRPG